MRRNFSTKAPQEHEGCCRAWLLKARRQANHAAPAAAGNHHLRVRHDHTTASSGCIANTSSKPQQRTGSTWSATLGGSLAVMTNPATLVSMTMVALSSSQCDLATLIQWRTGLQLPKQHCSTSGWALTRRHL
eukprot:NODE_14813_length_1084_cov_3.588297.p2 GENE.NODE_14813_length_1084_cov_3.588297~~NODE_14813_length_1084_cov_3.588297.p2  ORF type:complete len:132 (-),score=10.68 NODE_14813_length_1084_cov_3.588297:388-783(-)